jgi:predicted nucleic acid-binding protein
MYLWDANILRAFGQGHATLRSHLLRVPWSEVALPSVVVAEVLRRWNHGLKRTPGDNIAADYRAHAAPSLSAHHEIRQPQSDFRKHE